MAEINITADGSKPYYFNQYQDYYVEASGDFGGGSLSVQTDNGTEIIAFTAGSVYIFEPVGKLNFVLTGSTGPDITLTIKSHSPNKR